jgi:hypothetical protein
MDNTDTINALNLCKDILHHCNDDETLYSLYKTIIDTDGLSILIKGTEYHNFNQGLWNPCRPIEDDDYIIKIVGINDDEYNKNGNAAYLWYEYFDYVDKEIDEDTYKDIVITKKVILDLINEKLSLIQL